MYHPTHDPAMIRHMIDDGYAHADSDRLAALARGRRAPRPSRLAQVSGRIRSMVAMSLHHHPAPRTSARTIRP
jgi:hypothetical protein